MYMAATSAAVPALLVSKDLAWTAFSFIVLLYNKNDTKC